MNFRPFKTDFTNAIAAEIKRRSLNLKRAGMSVKGAGTRVAQAQLEADKLKAFLDLIERVAAQGTFAALPKFPVTKIGFDGTFHVLERGRYAAVFYVIGNDAIGLCFMNDPSQLHARIVLACRHYKRDMKR